MCVGGGAGGGGMWGLTFMMGMGSSPGAPRSSIMFLMRMERSATLRSARTSVKARSRWSE